MWERIRKDKTDHFSLNIQFGALSLKACMWSSKLLSLAETQMFHTAFFEVKWHKENSVCIYVYIYCIYLCMCVCVYIYIYIYIYIYHTHWPHY